MELSIIIFVLLLAETIKRTFNIHPYHSVKEKIFITTLIFVALVSWELINLHFGRAWVYSGNGVLGYNIFGLPFEMYLFYLVGPYFTFVIFEMIHHIVDGRV